MAPNSLTTTFGQRIRQLREAKGWSQEELASAASLHRTHISLIETGKRSVQLETVEQLAGAFGVEPAVLFSATAPPPTTAHARTEEGDLDRLMPALRGYQALATRHGIDDVFQDNGGKLVQTLILLGLQKLPKREGNDAKDIEGNEYELKTLNVKLTRSFSTHHHLNATIIRKYRAVTAWYFSVYEHIELVEIYRVTPNQLDGFFQTWERKLATINHINNPKIPLVFVRTNGERVYPRLA